VEAKGDGEWRLKPGDSSDFDLAEDMEEGSGNGSGRKRRRRKQLQVPLVKPWGKRELKALVDALVVYGEGRTEQVVEPAPPKSFLALSSALSLDSTRH
jgi:hypothetical protein